MKEYVSVHNFGTAQNKADLCTTISALTLYYAYVNDQDVVVIPCRSNELGDLFASLQVEQLRWIEYTVKFDC